MSLKVLFLFHLPTFFVAFCSVFLSFFFFCPGPELYCWPFLLTLPAVRKKKPLWWLLNWTLILGGVRGFVCRRSKLWASVNCRANWLVSACDQQMRLFCKIMALRNKLTLLLHYIIRKAHRLTQTHYSLTDKCCIIALMSHEMSVTDLAFHQRLVCLCKWGDSCNDIQYLLAVNRH